MQFRTGHAYRDSKTGVEFVTVQESHDMEANVIAFSMVNVHNWIRLRSYTGKLLSDGTVHCQDLEQAGFEDLGKCSVSWRKAKK